MPCRELLRWRRLWLRPSTVAAGWRVDGRVEVCRARAAAAVGRWQIMAAACVVRRSVVRGLRRWLLHIHGRLRQTWLVEGLRCVLWRIGRGAAVGVERLRIRVRVILRVRVRVRVVWRLRGSAVVALAPRGLRGGLRRLLVRLLASPVRHRCAVADARWARWAVVVDGQREVVTKNVAFVVAHRRSLDHSGKHALHLPRRGSDVHGGAER